MIPDSFIQSLLARVDVVDVVGRYVQLRKGGANLMGLCPFHKEKSPSFTVSPTKQFYHCFGCGAHGSAITFLMEHTGASFPQAVETLAQSVGLQIPQEQQSPAARQRSAQRRDERNAHTRVLDTASRYYRQSLRSSDPAIQYLKQRGLTGQIAARFGLGWAPEERQGLSSVFARYDDPILVEAGLVIESDDGRRYDRFRGRVMFPIRNQRGELIGFGGRIIGKGEPKYLNSPETPVFSKGSELYGLWEARQAIARAREVIVVEGYMDVVGLAQLGVENAVATLGTATTSEHLRKLVRFTDRIVFSFDGDAAGRRAAWRALGASLPILRDDLSVRFLFLPTEHDPDSYIRAFGQAAFRACVDESTALSGFLLQELAGRHRLDEPEGRSACIHEAAPLFAEIPDSAIKRQIMIEFAHLVRLTTQELEEALAGTLNKRSVVSGQPRVSQVSARDVSSERHVSGDGRPDDRGQRSAERGRAVSDYDAPARAQKRSVTPLAKRLLTLLLAHPALAQSVGEQQLEVLDQGAHLELVRDFILLVQSSSSSHLGALIEASDPDTDLAGVLKGLSGDLMAQADLPDPQAEWEDALRRIELESLKAEQARLVEGGLDAEQPRSRYTELTRRIQSLMKTR